MNKEEVLNRISFDVELIAPEDYPNSAAITCPFDVMAILSSSDNAYQVFLKYSYSQQKEVIDLINNAKKTETRQKRIAKLLTSLTNQ